MERGFALTGRPEVANSGSGRSRTQDLLERWNWKAGIPQAVSAAGATRGAAPALSLAGPSVLSALARASQGLLRPPAILEREPGPTVSHWDPRSSALVPGRLLPSLLLSGPRSPEKGHENWPNICVL